MSTDMGTGGSRTASGPARFLATIVLLAGLAAATAGVVLPVNQLTQPGGSVQVSAASPPVAAGPTLPEPDAGTAVSLLASDPLRLDVLELPAPLRVLTETPALVSGLLALVAAWLLHRVLLEIAAGRPFAPDVPQRLLGLALVAVAMSFVPDAFASAATVTVLEHTGLADSPDLHVTVFSLDLGMLLVAAILAVSASVFRHGGELARDTEGLV